MPPHQMERETGLEPATLALARRCSTTELFPQFNCRKEKIAELSFLVKGKRWQGVGGFNYKIFLMRVIIAWVTLILLQRHFLISYWKSARWTRRYGIIEQSVAVVLARFIHEINRYLPELLSEAVKKTQRPVKLCWQRRVGWELADRLIIQIIIDQPD